MPSDWTHNGRGSKKFGLGPSVWANPFVIGKDGDRSEVISLYAEYLKGQPD